MHDNEIEGLRMAQKMPMDYKNVKSTIAPPTAEPDSIESLLTQALTNAYEIKDALATVRHSLLGPWPEPTTETNKTPSPSGLIHQSREALYRLHETQREIREHIVAISKGVR